MDFPRTRVGRSTSLREPDTRLTESDKIEGAGSWEALEWTKIDVINANAFFPRFYLR